MARRPAKEPMGSTTIRAQVSLLDAFAAKLAANDETASQVMRRAMRDYISGAVSAPMLMATTAPAKPVLAPAPVVVHHQAPEAEASVTDSDENSDPTPSDALAGMRKLLFFDDDE